MFSPNQLYDYLRYYCHTNKKNVEVLHFLTNGSKHLQDLSVAKTPYISSENNTNTEEPHLFRETSGCFSMFDQEPIDIYAYYENSYQQLKDKLPQNYRLTFSPEDFVFSKSAGLYNPIIGVSEINSNSVKMFKNNFHIPVHFWANAITSKHWFLHYKLLTRINSYGSKRFGSYIRDTSGTRQYRKQLLTFFKTQLLSDIFCPVLQGQDNVSSCQSASIDWPDHNKFDIHIVPETIFDTEKTHLTEKIFKPIVMYQPFIVFAGPNSLQYIRNYGFKTFNNIFFSSIELI